MPPEVNPELLALEADLKQLEADYNAFFAGRAARPPAELRGRIETTMRRLDRQRPAGTVDRFRFSTLQSRHAVFCDLWDRGLRAREEGRPGPFAHLRKAAGDEPRRPDDRILYVTTFTNLADEQEKLEELYHSVVDARSELGASQPPFHRFAELVKNQISEMQKDGTREVAFRVAIADGRLAFTARGLLGLPADPAK
mgnify:FL=1